MLLVPKNRSIHTLTLSLSISLYNQTTFGFTIANSRISLSCVQLSITSLTMLGDHKTKEYLNNITYPVIFLNMIYLTYLLTLSRQKIFNYVSKQTLLAMIKVWQEIIKIFLMTSVRGDIKCHCLIKTYSNSFHF